MEKFCHSCKETYPLTPEFWHRNRKKPGGFDDECKKCRNKAQEKIRTRGIILKGLGDTTGYIAIKYRKEDLKNVRLKKGQKYRYHTFTSQGQGYRAKIIRECTVEKEYDNFIVLNLGDYKETVHKATLLIGAETIEAI